MTKLSMTQQQGTFTTRIRVPLRERFFAEKNKGQLINDLLELYYDQVSKHNILTKDK